MRGAITNICAISWPSVMPSHSRARVCVAFCWQQGYIPQGSSVDGSIDGDVSATRKRACWCPLDGSRHTWLEERGPWLCLIAAIDDATGKLAAAVFREEEDAAGYFLLV